ncbi:MAG: methylenetetrahydrofolate reductase [Candidatus Melainabacteria bacterium]|nr:methylenetetrahydrofolate reductase [Candidatus Melainabacteria bacterium]
MSLRKALQSNDFLVTAEINPPKGIDASAAIENVRKIKDLVAAVNITDNSAAAMKMASLPLSYLIQRETGVEAIWQITCRDRNRLALQSDLLGGAALGLSNLLVLKGDPPQEPVKEEKCFDLGTEDLLAIIAGLKEGKDHEGKELKQGAPDFCIAAAAHPGLPDLKAQRETMERRVGLGVEFFQTQICFEREQIDRFVESIGEELASKTILGITPLKSLKSAQFMNKNIFGVTVPEADMKVIEAAEDQAAAGLELSKKLVEHIKSSPLAGVHVMAIGQEKLLDQIITKING